MMEKNGKIQNKTNERIGKASEFYYLAKSLLGNKDIYRKCKMTLYIAWIEKYTIIWSRDMDMY
jgi:hypothetical protein